MDFEGLLLAEPADPEFQLDELDPDSEEAIVPAMVVEPALVGFPVFVVLIPEVIVLTVAALVACVS